MIRRPPRSTLFPYTTALPILEMGFRQPLEVSAAVRGWLAGARRSLKGDAARDQLRSEEHTSELQSQSNLVCRLLLEKKKKNTKHIQHADENLHRDQFRSQRNA